MFQRTLAKGERESEARASMPPEAAERHCRKREREREREKKDKCLGSASNATEIMRKYAERERLPQKMILVKIFFLWCKCTLTTYTGNAASAVDAQWNENYTVSA